MSDYNHIGRIVGGLLKLLVGIVVFMTLFVLPFALWKIGELMVWMVSKLTAAP